MATVQKITPFLCFDGNAEEAANFYSSIFKDSKVTHVSHYPEGSPSPAGSVMVVHFLLNGQSFMALNGGPQTTFNEAISLMVHCDTQEELDHYWEKLSDGGQIMACGWLKDKYGLAWQIVPSILEEFMTSKDTKKTERVMRALWQMVKIDIEKLQQAALEVDKELITVEATIAAPVENVWQFWTLPEHIIKWNHASDEWHSPRAENDLRNGGSFNYRMEAKDGSMGFDFNGTYIKVVENKSIEYEIEDGRKVQINFSQTDKGTTVTETFEAENMNPPELQQQGWQAILDNFKKYVEGGN